MPTHRYPLLLVREGPAVVVGFIPDHDASAFGATAAEVKRQLKIFLEWQHKDLPGTPGPDLESARLVQHVVSVRPEYPAAGKRIQPSKYPVRVRLPVILGIRANGQPMVDLPTLGLRFDYADDADPIALVERYAQQALSGLTPAQLAGHLAGEAEFDWLPVRVPAFRQAIDAVATPNLQQVAEALADRSTRAGFARAWCRDAELVELSAKLIHEKDSLLLLGETGAGKSTLLAGAAREVEQSTRKTRPSGHLFWLTSAGRLVAGMKYLGQWEERIEEVIGELAEIGGVLCVERVLDLVRRGGRGPEDSLAAFLAPYMARGEVRLVAEATPAEWEACRRMLPGFADLFQKVIVAPLETSKAVEAIDHQLHASAAEKKIAIEPGTARRIVSLFQRFQPYAVLPGPGAAFARNLAAQAARSHRKKIGTEEVNREFQKRTGLPERFLDDRDTLALSEVLSWFHQRVVDQPAACEAAAHAVLALKAGLNDPGRPVNTLLFCGPTGTGKTFLAQSLAEYLFGHGGAKKPGETPRLLRFDMSEYGGYDALPRLLGSDEPGELVRQVRLQPFCVVLLDEIEKAADDVFDALMGLLDEGRLTDPFGRETIFRSAVIIMTSNLGARRGGVAGFDATSNGHDYLRAVRSFFRPEFFNRLDAVVPFDPLKPNAVRQIARRELEAVSKREGLVRRGLTVHFSDSAIDHIAAVGCDAKYGARPMQRAVERIAVSALAQWLLEHSTAENIALNADWNGERIVVQRAVQPPSTASSAPVV